MTSTQGALAGVKVLDLSDERGIYGVKLLADLGADVVRPESSAGDPLRARGPHTASGDESLWHAYFASNRRFVTLDLANSESSESSESSDSSEKDDARRQLLRLVDAADIIVSCQGSFAVADADLEAAALRNPQLVTIDVTSFGDDEGPWRDYLAPDLVAGALGGSVATTGDVDTAPLKSFGELNFMVSGAYVAIAAMAGLLHAQKSGEGQRVGVPVHECIASCLEHVLMWYWYEPMLPSATSKVLPRRGSMHWSNAYKVMNAANGSIMVTPAPEFEKQIFWLVEEDAQEDLIDPKYLEPENLPLMIARVMEVLDGWVAGKDAEQLFFAAQERHAPYGWVLPVNKLAENPQLEARNWWVNYEVGGAQVRGPGAPYQFADTPWQMRPHGSAGADTQAVLADVGWNTGKKPAAQSSSPLSLPSSKKGGGGRRPLEGVRILDFTHVLAGPFATRVLADMGADVIKVNSVARAVATNDPTHPYYLMWNRSKRALALNMSNPEARPIARALAEQADVVIDNFSVGVLDRWGIGYDSVSAVNKGCVYVQMSGMGEGGPWSKFVTYAPTIHALAGLTQVTGVPGREDIGVGFSYNDHQAGLHGAVSILAALTARNRTGRGQRVDLSQFETGVNFLGPAILDWFANENAAEPCGNNLPYDSAAPHGTYLCKASADSKVPVATEDERWVAIACMSDDHWQRLCKLMGNPGWSGVDEFATTAGRVAAQATLDKQVAQWTSSRLAEDVMTLCQAAGVPAGVVQTGVDLLENDPVLAASKFSQPIADVNPAIGQTWADRLPLHFAKTPCEEYSRVREVGEDNAGVLADWLGMSAEQVSAAEADGRLT